jgi:hypothetical protein
VNKPLPRRGRGSIELGFRTCAGADRPVPRDLDTDSYSLVKPYPRGRHGTTYPDMAWEPKKSFTAVADY